MKRRKAELISVAKRRLVEKDREADSKADALDQMWPPGRLKTRLAPQPPIGQASPENFAVPEFSTCIPTLVELVSSKRLRDVELQSMRRPWAGGAGDEG